MKVVVWFGIIVAGLVVVYLSLALAATVCLLVWSVLCNIIRELGVRRRMRVAGRLVSRRKCLELMENSSGTLIIEWPTPSWNVSRVWWTSDDVLAEAPIPPLDAKECKPVDLVHHPFIEWCHKQCTELDGGTASLIAVYNGNSCAERLIARFPKMQKVDLWTGAIFLEEMEPLPKGLSSE